MVSGVEIIQYEIPSNSSIQLVTFAHEGDILNVLWVIAFVLLFIFLENLFHRYMRS